MALLISLITRLSLPPVLPHFQYVQGDLKLEPAPWERPRNKTEDSCTLYCHTQDFPLSTCGEKSVCLQTGWRGRPGNDAKCLSLAAATMSGVKISENMLSPPPKLYAHPNVTKCCSEHQTLPVFFQEGLETRLCTTHLYLLSVGAACWALSKVQGSSWLHTQVHRHHSARHSHLKSAPSF